MDKFNIPNPIQVPQNAVTLAEFSAGVRIVEALSKVKINATNYPNQIAPTKDAAIKVSAMGTPVVSNLHIQGGSYSDIYGNKINYSSIEVDTVLFNINQSRNIVKTPIQGLDGTVKEYISDGDYVINIRGIIQGQNGVYPIGELNKLVEIIQAKASLSIQSDYLQSLGIFNLVIESYSLPQDMGSQSQQVFELNCLSDTNYILFENQ